MPKRSLEKVGKKFGVSARSAEAWSIAFDWAERIQKRDEKAREKTEQKVTDEIATMRARHAARFTKIEEQFFAALETMSPEKAQEAFNIFKGAIDGQRQALGLPDQHVEHSGGIKVIFEDIEADARNKSKED